ncbi:MAG: methanol---5-hydroxybenzimidazolylcobamide Co-methyltransferase [Clostridia bacterium]|nr:methanol---5-hydroxybenzimidazolylcobamide Co-methyltransferase [Clostridia bacterium]
MAKVTFNELAINNLNDFVYGHAPKKIKFDNGMVIGGGTVYPEVNFTLPPMQVNKNTISKAYKQYKEMTEGVCQRAMELQVPGLVIEIELVPDMTLNPEWGIETTKIVKEVMNEYQDKNGLKSLLRITPVDVREGNDLEHMWRGKHWDLVMDTFKGCAENGADLLSIESVGGKNLHDDGVMFCDVAKTVFSLGIVAARDMEKLWENIVKIAEETNIIPAGDTACAFANTSMVLAVRGMIPTVFSAIDRVMCAVRTMIANEQGAIGPDKDCGYEGPYIKAITGTPISMEGKSAAVAHNSFCGNIAAAVADLWSNEAVENKRLLGGMTPEICTEMLVYDCRLMNQFTASGNNLLMRDMLVESDSRLDAHAYIMKPSVVLNIAKEIIKGKTHLERTKIAAKAAVQEIRKGFENGSLELNERELNYLNMIDSQLESIPDNEEEFIADMIENNTTEKFDPKKYDIA